MRPNPPAKYVNDWLFRKDKIVKEVEAARSVDADDDGGGLDDV